MQIHGSPVPDRPFGHQSKEGEGRKAQQSSIGPDELHAAARLYCFPSHLASEQRHRPKAAQDEHARSEREIVSSSTAVLEHEACSTRAEQSSGAPTALKKAHDGQAILLFYRDGLSIDCDIKCPFCGSIQTRKKNQE